MRPFRQLGLASGDGVRVEPAKPQPLSGAVITLEAQPSIASFAPFFSSCNPDDIRELGEGGLRGLN